MSESIWKKGILPLLLTAMICLTAGCPWGSDPMPGELFGVWETSEEKFKGFSFELTRHSIIFRDLNSAKGPEMNQIQKVQADRLDGRTLYTIQNETEQGLEHEFAFYYYPRKKEIRLKNQDRFVWKKKK